MKARSCLLSTEHQLRGRTTTTTPKTSGLEHQLPAKLMHKNIHVQEREPTTMTSPKSEIHVAVLGGGILGVSTAVHLLRSGASVVLITESGLASGATGRSLSWLNSAGKRSDAYHQLRTAGIDRYRTLFAADPTREWLQFDGGLYWAPAGEAAKAEARHEY